MDSIVSNTDIVDYISRYTELKKVGNTYRGKCPLHNGDNHNSLTVFENDNSFYCFSCGKGGSIINFVAEQEDCSYTEAIELLALENNIDISLDKEFQAEKTLYEANQRIAYKCYKKLDVVRDYLAKERGLSNETMDNFYLGYESNATGKAIVIPLHDRNGRIVAFCKRYLGDITPKYMNSTNNELYQKGEFLFNAYRARKMLENFQRLYICEGYIDAMSAFQQKLACVAYCGSELTKGQINEIRSIIKHTKNVTIMYAPDNDDVGLSKIQRTWEKFNELAPYLDVRVVKYPSDCKDFNEVLLKGLSIPELPSEPIALAAIKQALDNCMDKQQEFMAASEKIRYVSNPLIKQEIIEYLSKRWNKPVSDIKEITSIDFTDEELVNDFKDVDACFNDYVDLINTDGTGIGFPSVDASIKLRPSDVVFWAGYSGTFKTMVACEVALYNAFRLGKNVLFFSLEMSAGSLYERFIARIMKKPSWEIEEMVKNGSQAILLQKLRERIKEKIYIIDKSNLKMKDIEKYITVANNRILKEGQIDFVILDYFQYLNMQTFEDIASAAKYTKVIAKNNNLTFFILSQLNRTGDNFAKPTLKMLKGSGDLEASADYVVLSYTPDKDPKLTLEQREEVKNHICLLLGKARRGSKVNEFELVYNPNESKIVDLGAE